MKDETWGKVNSVLLLIVVGYSIYQSFGELKKNREIIDLLKENIELQKRIKTCNTFVIEQEKFIQMQHEIITQQ